MKQPAKKLDMNKLRQRCRQFLDDQGYSLISGRETVDNLVEFVKTELGRYDASGGLDDASSLVLYFNTKEGRDEFVKIASEFFDHAKKVN